MKTCAGIASTCQGCLTNCSVRVDVVDGCIAGVRGNDDSPATRGAICQNVRIAVEQAADPDRVLYPLRRTNPVKGRFEDPCWECVSWEEAIGEIADRLMALRAAGRSHCVAVAKGRSTGIGGLFSSAFPTIFGTPNSINHDSICNQGETVALGCLDGIWDYRDVDYAGCECLILWGMDPLASNRWKSRFRQELRGLKEHASIIVVDPRLSLTAKVADEWVPIIPGTDGALACAIAHVMVRDGLVDEAEVRARTRGFDEWWNDALCKATPEWAADMCGVDSSVIVRIARMFAAAGSHAVSWTSPGLAMAKHGFYSTMAAHALNGLAGSVQTRGGIVSYPVISKGSPPSVEPYIDDTARKGLAHERIDQRDRVGFMSAKGGKAFSGQNNNRIPEALERGNPYDLDMLIAYWCNFAFSAPGCQRWWSALERLPFYVDVTTHVSESSRFADIVLPARHHMFETWGVVNSRQGGRACLSIEQPCVAAPGEALGDETDVPFLLAEALAERGFGNLLAYYQSFESPVTGQAPTCGAELGEYYVQMITQPLWRGLSWGEVLERGVLESGGVEFLMPGAPLPTTSGAFEFESSALRLMLESYALRYGLTMDEAMKSLDYEARGRLAFLPHYEPPVRLGSVEEFPFVFTQHRSHASLEGRAANSPLFQELKGTDPGDEAWDDVVKLHPDDMRGLGLADGDRVRIVSLQGSIEVRAKGWDGTRPGVVVKCYGQGHWAYGHIAANRGGNNNELVPAEWERITSSAVRHGGIVRVRIERA